MKHDIFFTSKDELITWLDENFPDARLAHVESNGATYKAEGCDIVVTGHHLVLHFKGE